MDSHKHTQLNQIVRELLLNNKTQLVVVVRGVCTEQSSKLRQGTHGERDRMEAHNSLERCKGAVPSEMNELTSRS